MTATELTTNDFGPVKRLVVDSVNSAHSQRAYERALTDFLNWHVAQGCPQLRKATVQAYKRTLLDNGLAPATITFAPLPKGSQTVCTSEPPTPGQTLSAGVK